MRVQRLIQRIKCLCCRRETFVAQHAQQAIQAELLPVCV
jgi:hypothetical protein